MPVQSLVVVIVIGVLGGLAVGVQSPLASIISQRLGPLESVFIVHLGGALAAALPLLVRGGGQLGAWTRVPWYALGAGVLGVIVIGAVSIAIPRLGATATIILVVVGQLLVGILIDQWGLLGTAVRPIDLLRIAGIGLVVLGAWCVIR
ncbi:MAG: DMT family transporter [Chloroflexales bacterium]|nr:DMT family transporter [Chloroflexales bacterium]